MDRMKRTPVREQDVDKRIKNFNEVSLGYNEDEAIEEANRCLQCKKPMCVGKCPVNNKIPSFIKEIKERNFEGAAKIIAETSTLPAICGRVCPQELQCEGGCVLGIKGQPISIGNLERFVADWCRENDIDFSTKAKSNGKKVAVVGSGPAGITCAGDLAKLGYEVTIFEALHEPGGVLTWGIPEFVLPKETVVKHEIDNVKKLGVKLETDVMIGRTLTIDQLLTDDGFSAVFVGAGAAVPNFMGIPGENLNGVLAANEFLTKNNLMKDYRKDYKTPLVIGKKVAVVGGGNVAIDAVRSAIRLGAEAYLIYRRSESELPARVEEVKFAKSEGVEFHLLTNPTEILGDENGWVKGIKCIKMKLGEPDESGRRSPIAIEGSEFTLDVDMVIMAIGSRADSLIKNTTDGLKVTRKNLIDVDEETGRTSKKGVYAGGDIVSGPATVILAMGAGKKAAKAIHEDLSSQN
ncbi:glutamate synthase (NADPH/NADH) small chain [Clostridium acidisoli DSM 12555]|uniref:Glutamate synthase (NADPH/NADH) small chain n=1 Tax=Clostridium acidisoli DSM 12555 TaxID=1121291 RepID=A0A1W1XG70_9CLOT|nr:NADPH-dependent glutamate synthase [Clostridium acidisoli]SMC22996.1 glutamate synthase (NADPH/NADH) small chain [Clostridium acidisoli DSM 12555]